MIDWNRVFELREEIGEEDFAEVVELFLEEVDAAMAKLRAGLPQDQWECCLHFLKGSALNLGFDAFSTLCAAGEAAAASAAYQDVDMGGVIDAYDRSKATFLAELSDRLAA